MKTIVTISIAALLLIPAQTVFAHSYAQASQAEGWQAYHAFGGTSRAARFDDGIILHGHDDGSRDTATGGPVGGIN